MLHRMMNLAAQRPAFSAFDGIHWMNWVQGVEVTVGEGEGKHPVTEDPSDDSPPVFDWAAPGHGFVRKRGFNRTQLLLSLDELTLEANLSRPVCPWYTSPAVCTVVVLAASWQ